MENSATPAHTAIDIGDTAVLKNKPTHLEFYSNSTLENQITSIGMQDSYPNLLKDDSKKRYRKLSHGGKAASFLENHGFGWLLEVEEEEDEQKPLLEELDIDFKEIYYKVRCVLLPLPYFRLKLSIVRESPDFWGPLLVVLTYGLLSLYGQLSVLSWILTIWFSGSFCIFFLARVLGGDVTYSQVLGVIGYCLMPIVAIGLLIPLFRRFWLLKFTLCSFGVLWSVYSAGALICVEELNEKRTLLLYPVLLLYIYFLSLYTGV
uniref:Protein YIPF n=1 Tax=Syphacia muris TaxID=451379 RepID=A0A0N5AF71_9BILA